MELFASIETRQPSSQVVLIKSRCERHSPGADAQVSVAIAFLFRFPSVLYNDSDATIDACLVLRKSYSLVRIHYLFFHSSAPSVSSFLQPHRLLRFLLSSLPVVVVSLFFLFIITVIFIRLTSFSLYIPRPSHRNCTPSKSPCFLFRSSSVTHPRAFHLSSTLLPFSASSSRAYDCFTLISLEATVT